MKNIKYIITAIALTFLALGCMKPDELVREDTGNMMELTVRGTLLQNGLEYDAVVDEEARTVKFTIPYFVSNEEEIMSDLSEFKFRATLPLGAKFEPSLKGIHDLSDNKVFVSTLVYETGERHPYTFSAMRQRSQDARILSAALTSEDVRTIISIEHPTEEAKGKIKIMQSSGMVLAAMQSVKLTLSPWATAIAPSYDPSTGIVDLTYASEVIVIAQDGSTRAVYQVSVETPALVPAGQVGHFSPLFGFQLTAANPRGFEQDANYTMAVVDDYLIISNRKNVDNMLVLSRFTGRQADGVQVNTSGIDAGREIRAITTDDDGKLVAFAYTNTCPITDVTVAVGRDFSATPVDVKAWIWRNGIESAPELILNIPINSGDLGGLAPAPKEIGNVIRIKGSLSSGRAVLTTTDKEAGRIYAIYFEDGQKVDVGVNCPNINGGLRWRGTWVSSKAIPVDTEKPLTYFLSLSTLNQEIDFCMPNNYYTFDMPASYWWRGSGSSDRDTRGMDVIEFNGTYLLAVANGFGMSYGATYLYTYDDWAHRLYVANLGASPTKLSLKDGFIFDSRNHPVQDKVTWEGYSPQGMTSTIAFDGTTKFGGDSRIRRGDVVFHRDVDGNAVQVYMLATNAGLMAFEITRYDM